MSSPGRSSGDTAAARRLVHAIARRAALHEAVGVVQAWGGGLERLRDQDDDADREAEVARVNAVVDAAAERRADPDWDDQRWGD